MHSEEVKENESEVLGMNFNPAESMIKLYGPIEKLQKLAKDANIEYSDAQVLNFGLTILRNTRDFELALGEWHAKPEREKTWDNFKVHFREAQATLKKIRGPTMQQAGFHYANLLAEQIFENMENYNVEMLQMLQNVITPAPKEPRIEENERNVAYTVVEYNVQLQLLQLL